ncbi:thiolase family protein [Burkholderia vietnamiensis]|uniref:Thiolase family protein n=1 Tax=Burkholderia vietnamiensis TaxID=60552 RepID=A0AAW7T0M6_BURVI|nr:thiolase family protein [Burkholderia vietnamiensis]MBH9645806.1 thiolase family protein [Burkholderia vietnamiensis]MBR8008920.1 thiolase family protein [Burkholderia vietnamiensis]MDN7551261.1 thiolase family protein [Burkholderia vietnamiensis]MDN7795075.1 thiolase family protein [Burkholderia vietnamiensis]MDN8044426.1 thiolase family protein [Burkholderia vietnamiensis]
MNDHEPVIVGALRTPVGKRGGRLKKWHPVDLLGETLHQLVERSGVNPADLDDVIVGCVLQWEQQHGNLGRHAVLAAGFPESVPAVTVDRQCGSGQQAVSFAVHGVKAGVYKLVIGAGVESMSQAPMPASFMPGAPLGVQYSPRELKRYQDNPLLPQGASSELMNKRFDLTREQLDAFAARSHRQATAAVNAGHFREQLVWLTEDPADPDSPIVAVDEGVRAEPDLAKMAALKPVFAADGATTAANSSQISDGAAALLIASRAYAEQHGLKPRARFVSTAVAAADPVIQFTAVLDATRKALSESGLTIADIDLFEVNEAFGGVPLMFQNEFRIPDDRLNVNGGSVAIGHPLGSTGARMLTDLLCELERRGARYGLQTICEASGTANTTIIERL